MIKLEGLVKPVAAVALAIAMVGLTAGGAEAKEHRFRGHAIVTFSPKGEVLRIKDTKRDGRYIEIRMDDHTADTQVTPFCVSRHGGKARCNYSIKEGHKLSFRVYSVGEHYKDLGVFYEYS
ncbi:hypothetical protein AB0H07_47175 [Streptomyces sp. NPDC021354]|uniref:hypothetical protein n=1 Tax=Streptomyces sp. NPDC021354 TaxID=3154793 RepID=UPI0033F024D8